MKILCACGCGLELEKYDYKKREKRYIMGHHITKIFRKLMEEKDYNIIKENNCWEWKKTKLKNGYGVYCFHGERIYAHRKSYEFHNNVKLNREEMICHKCDNPLCINPDHLFLGSQFDNIKDGIDKGRIKGKSHSKEIVLKIRKLYNSGEYKQIELSRMFGVEQSVVSGIINYKKRKNG